MRINLSNEKLFDVDEMNIDKKVTFVYGKNGTGKSTLTRIFQQQANDYEVHVFQGFNELIGENERLNAVILGEENEKIEKEIKKLNEEKEKLIQQKDEVIKTISEPEEESESNYWTRYNKAKAKYEEKESEITDIMKKGAAKIKGLQNPSLAKASYNIKGFREDISKAKVLDEKQYELDIELLRTTVKVAPNISEPNIDLVKLQDSVNTILQQMVEEKTVIERFENDPVKRKFAYDGLQIHHIGDVCAFCGASLEERTLQELKRYFSVDEVKKLQNDIQIKIEEINKMIRIVESFYINREEFYPEYAEKLIDIEEKLGKKNREYIDFLEVKLHALEQKKSNLFEVMEPIRGCIPDGYQKIVEEYNQVRDLNNASELESKQDEAREELRLHTVKTILDETEYFSKLIEKDIFLDGMKKEEEEFNSQKEKIYGPGGIEENITKIEQQIDNWQEKTISEKKLAYNINRKLKHMVSFELVHCEDEKGKGYYQIKNIKTGIIREVTKLSTGEKNIIAFLYFMEKLNEVKTQSEHKPKLVIFDDPMSSNDDNMQYLIIEDLQNLMKTYEKKNDYKIIILTHNKHFYLNVKFLYSSFNFHQAHFWRLISDGNKTSIMVLQNKEEDFVTSYGALWKELIFLYENENAAEEMLLNPMRRIIETFTKFNGINRFDFLEQVEGAKKIFDVNSHSIDDLEADLCGKTKAQIKSMFCDCFCNNKFEKHLRRFWPEAIEENRN